MATKAASAARMTDPEKPINEQPVSPNTSGKESGLLYLPKTPDVEKSIGAESVGVQQPTADNLPSKLEREILSSDDAHSSEIAEDKQKKVKEGGMKDYFVSGKSVHPC